MVLFIMATQSFRNIYRGESGSQPITSSPLQISWRKTFLAIFSTSLFSCLPSVSECLQKRRERERDGERGRKAGKQRAESPLIRALPYKCFLFLTFCLNEFLFQGLRQVCFPFQSIVQGVPYL